MNTKMRTNKKMIKGFMCHSPAATAVCMTGDHQSVIIPRRPDRRLVDRERLINTAKYTRIVEQKRRHHLASTGTKRSSSTSTSGVPVLKTKINDEVQVKKENNARQLTLLTNVDEVQVKKENNARQLTVSTNVDEVQVKKENNARQLTLLTNVDEVQVKKENNARQLTLSTNVDEVQVKKENNLPQLTLSTNVVQEVVMRVSLHCHGCAGKVKKLLSKMEGVTSFTVDLETKRVTVKGHVSPVSVLESISRVKKAEFWSSFP